MDVKILLFLLIILVSVGIVLAATAIITVNLSRSSVWWNDTVTINGTANYTNGTTISNADVNITIGNVKCNNVTDSNGFWSCTFRSPLELGTYNVSVNITKSGENFFNSTSLQVKPTYGGTPIGTGDRVAYEVPMLIQEPSGRIRWVWVTVLVWKG